jgi:enoyl-CoA hydratase
MKPVNGEFAEGRLLTSTDGVIGWLTINQPERLNAVRYDMWQALPAAVASLEAQAGVRVIVVRGAGEKAFASGADIAEFETERFDAASNHQFTEAVSAATGALVGSPLPVIAMIHGYCIGGGMVISSACDIRIASEDAQFAVPAGKLGLGYELDNYKRLAGIVGPGMAMEFLATARRFNAAEAKAAGFLNRVTAADRLQYTIAEYAAMIATTAPLSLAAAKLAGRAAIDPRLNAEAQAAIDVCFDSVDYKEGRAAFREKRAPRFTGK